ncbi:MAG: response regulator transcription factor [Chloroflexi bacterium]|nr:response regulator transcription factor [Chloroflexota bacterium]
MILTGISDVLLKTGRTGMAVELLTLAARHPFNDVPARRRAEDLLQRARAMLPADVFEQASTRGAALDLETAAASVREQLALGTLFPAHPHRHAHSAPLHQDLIEPLSDRELEILQLMSDGLTNQQIAEKLTIVLGTVKAHNHNIFGKLGVGNRVQAIARARTLNLL